MGAKNAVFIGIKEELRPLQMGRLALEIERVRKFFSTKEKGIKLKKKL